MKDVFLNNGVKIPSIGFGTFPQKDELVDSVKVAAKANYSLYDTSDNYYNEEFLGQAIVGYCDVASDIIVSKFSQPHRTKDLKKCFDESRGKLAGKLDVYLLHWPYPFLWKIQWKKMEKLYLDGKCKAIGVCNFEVSKLKRLLKFARVKPAINQIERHPLFQQNAIVKYCKDNDIYVMAYSPLGRQDEEMFSQKILKDLANKYSKSIGQIILRWDVDTGTIPIPSSRSSKHIKENVDIFDFALSNEEIKCINGLDIGKRIRYDPKKRFSCKEKIIFFITRIKMIFIPE